MLTIRMRRVGAKKKPYYRVVVTEARTARDGAALEVLGYYHPAAQPETVEIDRGRLQHWVERGAQMSDTVRTLVARNPLPAAEVEAPAAVPESEAPAAESETPAAESETPAAAPESEAAAASSEPEAPGGAAAATAGADATEAAAPEAGDTEAQTS